MLTYDFWQCSCLLLCIRTNDHAGGFCMSPILLYHENWVRIVLFLSEPVDVVFGGSSLFAEIYLHSLLVCKHIRS